MTSALDRVFIDSAAKTCRRAADAALEEARRLQTTVKHHGADVPISTAESTLAMRRHAFWAACARDIEQLAGEPPAAPQPSPARVDPKPVLQGGVYIGLREVAE